MKDLSYGRLRREAAEAVSAGSYSPGKLVLIHSGVSLGVGLLLSIVTYLLDLGIAQTGGLGGIGQRTVLESVQTVLSAASMMLLPFWEIGYIYLALQWARRQASGVEALLSGFRNWGPVLRGMLVKAGILLIALFFTTQLVSTVYMMTPAAAPIYELVAEMAAAGNADTTALLENEAYMALMMKAIPFMLIGSAIVMLPLMYLLRFTDYALMDQPQRGALVAVVSSIRMTRRNLKALLKLDLRYWWYFGLELLAVVISYGHLILDFMGVDIGIGGDTAMFVFYILSIGGQLALYWWQKNVFVTTYALAYEELCQPEAPRMPWPGENMETE